MKQANVNKPERRESTATLRNLQINLVSLDIYSDILVSFNRARVTDIGEHDRRAHIHTCS